MFPRGDVFTFRVLSTLEGRCRGVVRLSILPKAAYFEGRCRGAVPSSVLVAMFPRGGVFTFRVAA